MGTEWNKRYHINRAVQQQMDHFHVDQVEDADVITVRTASVVGPHHCTVPVVKVREQHHVDQELVHRHRLFLREDTIREAIPLQLPKHPVAVRHESCDVGGFEEEQSCVQEIVGDVLQIE